VTGLDNLSACGDANLKYLAGDNFIFIEGDIRDVEACEQAVEGGVDYALHHAAIGSVKASFDDPETTHDVNVTGFENVAIKALESGAQKILYASSSAVYGDSDVSKNQEDQLLKPLSPYAQSKIDNEKSARALYEKHQSPIIGLRYFNIYGARQNPNGDYAAVIPKWIERGLNDQPAIIYGDGSAVRDFCYIDDIIRLNMLAMIKGQETEVYNGASGISVTVKELEQIIRDNLGAAHPPVFENPREGDIHTSIADITKAQRDLGFAAQADMSVAIARTIKFYPASARKAA